jgi:hypothetical protein
VGRAALIATGAGGSLLRDGHEAGDASGPAHASLIQLELAELRPPRVRCRLVLVLGRVGVV